MKKVLMSGAAVVAAVVMTGCCTTQKNSMTYLKDTLEMKPTLFANLGDSFSVPDGMAIDVNGNVVLAVPNYLSFEKDGAKIVTMDKDGNVISTFSDLPKNSVTGKVHPMGIEFGPDGNLYIADNQCFSTSEAESRILRLNYKDGQAVDCEVVVEGTYVSNAIRWKGNDLYLTDSILQNRGEGGVFSGVMRFSLEELSQGHAIQADQEKHLITLYKGVAGGFGADGMCFDKAGNMYVGCFSGGQFFRTSFNADGSVKKTVRMMNSPSFKCCDGMTCDKEANVIYTTDSKMNAVWKLDLNTNRIQRLWENPDSDGADGSLDQPCEPLVYGNDLLVVNFDYSFPGLMNRESDSVNTISKIRIK